MNKRKIITLGLIAVIAISFFGLYYVRLKSKSNESLAENTLTSVETKEVKVGKISKYEKYTGKTKGGLEENVSPKVPANVVDLMVSEGDYVEEGDILMVLDSAEVDEQVEKAKEAYEKALEAINASNGQVEQLYVKLANLENEISNTTSIIESSNIKVAELQAQLKELESKLENEEISKDEFEKRKLEINKEIMTNTNEIAMSTKKLTEQEMTKASIEKTLEGAGNMDKSEQLDQLAKMYETALEAKENYTIKAGISGIVKNLNVAKGEPAMSLFGPCMVITNDSFIAFDIQVAEENIDKFSIGEEINVTVEGVDGFVTTSGVIKAISDTPDKKLKQYIVTISVDNRENSLAIGNYASAMIDKEVKENILVIDKNSLMRESGVNYVFRVEENKVYKTEVEIGIENDHSVEIISGLSENDRIVSKGKEFISNEEAVNVVGGKK